MLSCSYGLSLIFSNLFTYTTLEAASQQGAVEARAVRGSWVLYSLQFFDHSKAYLQAWRHCPLARNYNPSFTPLPLLVISTSIRCIGSIPRALLQCHERKMAAYACAILVAYPHSGSRSPDDVLRAKRNRVLTVSHEGMRGSYDRLLNSLG